MPALDCEVRQRMVLRHDGLERSAVCIEGYLKTHGSIDAKTVQELGTRAAHRLLSRLRRKGYLHPPTHPNSYVRIPAMVIRRSRRW